MVLTVSTTASSLSFSVSSFLSEIAVIQLCQINVINVDRFLYVAHAWDEEILVYTRNNDNSVNFSHVSRTQQTVLGNAQYFSRPY